MTKTFTKFGAAAVALAMSGLPAVALAENVSAGGVSVQGENVQAGGVQVQEGNVQAGNVRVQTAEDSSQTNVSASGVQVQQTGEQQKQGAEVSKEQQKNNIEVTSVNEESVEGTKTEQNLEQGQEQEEIDLELEDDSNPATSLEDLKQKIENRKNELNQEAASSTPDRKDIVENANPVRLAVHALLASKDFIGGIGGQVSEIAKQMNDSVATTTNAEVKIQSRGFISRLFFGGDKTSAEVIAQAAAKNQDNIAKLTELLGQANVSADVQVTLKAQITALQTAQARLQALAEKEQKAWGLFSWRF